MVNKFYFLFISFIVGIYTLLISADYSPFLYTLIIILFLYFLSSSFKAHAREMTAQMDVLLPINLAISLNSAYLVSQYIAGDGGFISGFYPEPSHLGYTIGPLLIILIANKKTRLSGATNFLIAGFASPSATLLFSAIVTATIWFFRFIKPIKLLSLSILLVLLSIGLLLIASFYLENLLEVKQASLQIWLYGFVRASETFHNISPFGVGPFGWIPQGGEEDASSLAIELMNQRDLASLIPFGFASLGLFFPIIFLMVLHFLSNFDKDSNLDVILSIIVLGYILTFCFRWAGITLAPILVFASLLIAIRWEAKDRKKISLFSVQKRTSDKHF